MLFWSDGFSRGAKKATNTFSFFFSVYLSRIFRVFSRHRIQHFIICWVLFFPFSPPPFLAHISSLISVIFVFFVVRKLIVKITEEIFFLLNRKKINVKNYRGFISEFITVATAVKLFFFASEDRVIDIPSKIFLFLFFIPSRLNNFISTLSIYCY